MMMFEKYATSTNILRIMQLSLYLQTLHILHWSKLTELFLENYSIPGELSLAHFQISDSKLVIN